jgi:hypothetical protein
MSAPTIHTDLTHVAREALDMPTPAYQAADEALDWWAALRVAQRSAWQAEAEGVALEVIEARRARLEGLADRAWLRFSRRLQATEGVGQ